MEWRVVDEGAGEGEDGSPFSIPRPSVSVMAHDPLLAAALEAQLEAVGFAPAEPELPGSNAIGFSTHVSVCVPPQSTRAFTDGAWNDRMLERADLAALVVMARAQLPVFELVDRVPSTRGVVVLDGDDPASLDRLPEMVWYSAAGQRFVDPDFADATDSISSVSKLSNAERRVFDLLATGASNKGIADALFVSQRTVEVHVRHILVKLGIPKGSSVNRRVLAALHGTYEPLGR